MSDVTGCLSFKLHRLEAALLNHVLFNIIDIVTFPDIMSLIGWDGMPFFKYFGYDLLGKTYFFHNRIS